MMWNKQLCHFYYESEDLTWKSIGTCVFLLLGQGLALVAGIRNSPWQKSFHEVMKYFMKSWNKKNHEKFMKCHEIFHEKVSWKKFHQLFMKFHEIRFWQGWPGLGLVAGIGKVHEYAGTSYHTVVIGWRWPLTFAGRPNKASGLGPTRPRCGGSGAGN
jgi:hypothetical protein